MSGIFKAGQLVAPMDWAEEGVDLYSVPGGTSHETVIVTVDGEQVRCVGHLKKTDVGLVISIERTDGGSVYVTGANGSGWAFGAFLRIVKQA